MIQVTSLRKRYGDLEVLRSITLSVMSGSITGLAGPNACGKTTLVKLLLGLVFPDGGEIRVNDLLAGSVAAREQIGYMPQVPDFPPRLTANELFLLLGSIRNSSYDYCKELTNCFELAPHLNKPLGELSTGTRQKISAVAALMFQSPLLVLDEPTAGFDPIACVTFKELLLNAAKQGTTILIVSHIIPELEQIASDLVFMLDGQIRFSGPVSTLKKQTGVDGLEKAIVALLRSPAEQSKAGDLQ